MFLLFGMKQCVLDENIRLMPALPQPDAVHSKYLTILSRRDLGYFGIDAKQVISPCHVIVESNGKIFKVVKDQLVGGGMYIVHTMGPKKPYPSKTFYYSNYDPHRRCLFL